MKKTTTLGILGLALIGGATQASAEVESLLGDSVSGEISAGWDSRYFYRGLWFGDETAWTNIEFSKELGCNLTGSVNLFYTDVADDALAYSEGNVGATLSYDAGFGTFDFGFVHFRFYDGFAGSSVDSSGVFGRSGGVAGNRDATELNLTYSQDLFWGFSGHLLVARDLRIDGTYGEFGISKSFSLCDNVSLDFSAAAGYSFDDYYSSSLSDDEEEGFTHTVISLALPIALTDSATLTPHVTANISHESRENTNAGADRDDTEIFWGASFAVGF